MKDKKLFTSVISGKDFPESERIPGSAISCRVLDLIQTDFPDFSSASNISISELNVYREKYISDYLSKETGNLSDMESAVLKR